jgi:hypothetical protein
MIERYMAALNMYTVTEIPPGFHVLLAFRLNAAIEPAHGFRADRVLVEGVVCGVDGAAVLQPGFYPALDFGAFVEEAQIVGFSAKPDQLPVAAHCPAGGNNAGAVAGVDEHGVGLVLVVRGCNEVCISRGRFQADRGRKKSQFFSE